MVRLRRFAPGRDARILARNVALTGWNQGLLYLLPLVTVPLIIRALEVENFATYALAAAYGAWFQVFPDYGFGLVGPREISTNRHSAARRARVFASIQWAKLLVLAVLVPVGLLATSLLVPDREFRSCLLWVAFGGACASLTPTWYFQGIERLGSVTLISTIGRVAQLAFVVILVRDPGDLVVSLAIPASIAAGIAILVNLLAFRDLPRGFARPRGGEILERFRAGASIFGSQLLVIANNNMPILLVSQHCRPEVVGAFAVADRIVKAAILTTNPLSQAIFPRVSALWKSGAEAVRGFLGRILWMGLALWTIVAVAMAAFAPSMVRFFSGTAVTDSVAVVRILCAMPLLVFLDNILGTQILLQTGRRKAFLWSIAAGVGLSLVAQALWVPVGGIEATAWSILLGECTTLALFARAVSRRS